MTKLISLLSLLALAGMAILDKSPDITSASIRMALALTFSASFLALARKQIETLLDR